MTELRQRFTQHLEALRRMLVGMAIAWFLGVAVIAVHFNAVLSFLQLPLQAIPGASLITLSPLAGLFIGFSIVATGGTIVAAPLMLLHLMRFVAPALKPREQKLLLTVGLLAVLLFSVGVVFGFAWMLPVSLQIAFAIQKAMGFQLLWSAHEYFGLVVALPLMMGLSFCIPLIMGVLVRFGVLPYHTLARRWDMATLVILFLAAAVTPTGDPVSFLFIALPLAILYALALVFGRPPRSSC